MGVSVHVAPGVDTHVSNFKNYPRPINNVDFRVLFEKFVQYP